jgi:hypothetical protein
MKTTFCTECDSTSWQLVHLACSGRSIINLLCSGGLTADQKARQHYAWAGVTIELETRSFMRVVLVSGSKSQHEIFKRSEIRSIATSTQRRYGQDGWKGIRGKGAESGVV